MSVKKKSDFILVFDRYFSKQPDVAASIIKRTVYGCAECVCMMFCLLVIYNIPVNPFLTALCCVAATAFFCVLFGFVRKRLAVPVILTIGVVTVRANIDAVWENFQFFVDAVFRGLDGVVFSMKRYMWHPELTETDPNVIMPTIVGITLIMSVICAGAMFRKPTGTVPLVTFSILIAPMIAAQKLSFNLWLIPTAALLIGGFAASKAFSGGIITRGGAYGGCKNRLSSEEQSFGANTANVPAIQFAKTNFVHYSKYFSAAVSAAAVFVVTGIIGSVIMQGKLGIDYRGIYDLFSGFGKKTVDHPSVSGTDENEDNVPFSEVFSQSLGVGSSVSGNRDIIRVINTGATAYLRGDIGTDFDGKTWRSLTENRNMEENRFCFSEMSTFLKLRWSEDERFANEIIPENWYYYERSEIMVNYIAQTDVVFLPSNLSSYPEYFKKNYELYGDYVVRKGIDDNKQLIFSSDVPSVNYSGTFAKEKTQIFESINRIVSCFNYDRWCIDYLRGQDIYEEYKKYINGTYMSVPENMVNDITDFLNETGLYRSDAAYADDVEKYKLCIEITDYLKKNYTYALGVDNGKDDPVMTFLKETKSGHCALYASAMTLMLRSMGIPARYCTGFVALHSDPDEEMRVLKAKNLHAWCEVYFNNIGWVTFDPTSNAIADTPAGTPENPAENPQETESSVSDSTQDESSETESLTDSETENEESSEISDESSDEEQTHYPEESSADNGQENTETNVLPFVLAGSAAALAVAAAITALYKFRKLDKAAKNALENAKIHGSCEEIYAKIIAVLELCGYRQNTGEQPDSFFARADRHFRTKLSKHSRTLLKIAFAKGGFSEAELCESVELLKDLFAAADSQLVAIGRVKLRRIVINDIRTS